MAADRITKDHLPLSFGSFKPVGHVVVVVENDEASQQFAQALGKAGFAADDIVQFSGPEWVERTEGMLPQSSGMAGFGSEIQHMRQHYMFAVNGNSLLIVHAPESEQEAQVGEIAKRLGAKVAQSYGRLTVEDLI